MSISTENLNDQALVALWQEIETASNRLSPFKEKYTTAEEIRGFLSQQANVVNDVSIMQVLRLQRVPTEIGGFKRVWRLDLSNGSLEELPDAIYELPCVEEFYVGNNRLKSLSPKISQWAHLRTLAVYNNQLTELPKFAQGCPLQCVLAMGNPTQYVPESIRIANVVIDRWELLSPAKWANIYDRPSSFEKIEIPGNRVGLEVRKSGVSGRGSGEKVSFSLQGDREVHQAVLHYFIVVRGFGDLKVFPFCEEMMKYGQDKEDFASHVYKEFHKAPDEVRKAAMKKMVAWMQSVFGELLEERSDEEERVAFTNAAAGYKEFLLAKVQAALK